MSETYRIKPLVWKRAHKFSHERFKTTTLFGEFVIRTMNDSLGVETPDDGILTCDSIEEGKAKAESYYHERLMQALEPIKTIRVGEIKTWPVFPTCFR